MNFPPLTYDLIHFIRFFSAFFIATLSLSLDANIGKCNQEGHMQNE